MVLIWTKERGKRLDIIIMQKSVLKDMIEIHVNRRFKENWTKTCLVTEDNDWTGFPSIKRVIKLLKLTLYENRIDEKIDLRMKIPHFSGIKCRKFMKNNRFLIPASDTYDGYFSISFIRIIGRTRSIEKYLKDIPGIRFNIFTRHKIKRVFEKYVDRYDKVFVFAVSHINPV